MPDVSPELAQGIGPARFVGRCPGSERLSFRDRATGECPVCHQIICIVCRPQYHPVGTSAYGHQLNTSASTLYSPVPKFVVHARSTNVGCGSCDGPVWDEDYLCVSEL
jgi:hypothetical protein